jgi:hypothetical protein
VHKFDRDYFTKVSAKLRPAQMVDETLSARDLYPFEVPSIEEIERVGVFGIHLGDYIFWDEERQTEFVREHYGWKENGDRRAYGVTRAPNASWPGCTISCYLKRGYGCSTFRRVSTCGTG